MRLLSVLWILVPALISCSPQPSVETPSQKFGQQSHRVGALENQLREFAQREKGLSSDEMTLAKKLKENLLLERENLNSLRRVSSLSQHNLSQLMQGNGNGILPAVGTYRVLVIPVEFKDIKLSNGSFFAKGYRNQSELSQADVYLFGSDNATDGYKTDRVTLTTYFRHASLGHFNLTGTVFSPVTLPQPRSYYGAQSEVSGPDMQPQNLVVDALDEVKKSIDRNGAITDKKAWWAQFDQWDPSDFDQDGNYHEPDGFIDSVMIVYAGNSQASCQAVFENLPENAGAPLKEKAKECFDRLWPQRSGITTVVPIQGPLVDGVRREPLGQRINNNLHAYDFNMQSEYSDIATFAHEFLHSLMLPDVYAADGGNGVGLWDLMSEIAESVPQELPSYERVLAGWLAPKIIRQGEEASLPLGLLNITSLDQRNRANGGTYSGPDRWTPPQDASNASPIDITSLDPQTGAPVYRSIVVVPDPEVEVGTPSAEAKSHQQLYFLEYRDPTSPRTDQASGYNFDQHTHTTAFAMFHGAKDHQTTSLLDQFRLVEVQYQPGLLIWYFNDRQPRTPEGNSPTLTGGLGHLLTVNPQVRETRFPGDFADPALFDRDGFYNTNATVFNDLYNDQEARFTCFAKIRFLRNLERQPDCQRYDILMDQNTDLLETLTLDGKKLTFTYQKLETLLPFTPEDANQETYRGVSDIVFASPYTRTAYATLQNPGTLPLQPLRIYRKGSDNNLVPDLELMRQSPAIEPIHAFNDMDYRYPETRPSDTVKIVPRGLKIELEAQVSTLLNRYNGQDPNANDHPLRAPQTQVLVHWQNP